MRLLKMDLLCKSLFLYQNLHSRPSVKLTATTSIMRCIDHGALPV